MKKVLEPVLVPDALLVSDANRCYPPVAAALDIRHESINASAGERVQGAVHIQTVNSRHSQIKGFLHGSRVVRQSVDALPEEAPAPFADRVLAHADLGRHGLVAQPVCATQDHAAAIRE